MDDDVFRISHGTFEGPLDLLLQLIEKRKLLINDISLATVTDDFIAYVKELGEIPLAQTAHFVYIAATLVLIKSKSLLPVLSLTSEEQESIDDLELRLKLYRYFAGLSQGIRKMFGAQPLFARLFVRSQEVFFSPPKEMSVQKISVAMQTVLANLPQKTLTREVAVKRVVSLETMIENLKGRIQKAMSMSFKDFSEAGKKEKVYVIVGFLAMLELVKQEIISVKQEEHFGDIHMESTHVGLPQYGDL